MNEILEIALLYNPRSDSCRKFSHEFGKWKTPFPLSPFCIDSLETVECCRRQGITELPCIVIVKKNGDSPISLKQGRDSFLWMKETFQPLNCLSFLPSSSSSFSSLYSNLLSNGNRKKERFSSDDSRGGEGLISSSKIGREDPIAQEHSKSILEKAILLQEQREQLQSEKNEPISTRPNISPILSPPSPSSSSFRTPDFPLSSLKKPLSGQTPFSSSFTYSPSSSSSSQKNEMWKNLLPENTLGGSVSRSIHDSERAKSVALLAKQLEKDRELLVSPKSFINI